MPSLLAGDGDGESDADNNKVDAFLVWLLLRRPVMSWGEIKVRDSIFFSPPFSSSFIGSRILGFLGLG